MSRLALLSITALVLLSACVSDRGPSYYRDSNYGYSDGYYGGSRYGYKDSYRYRYRDRDRDRYRSYRPYRGYYYYDPGPRPVEGP